MAMTFSAEKNLLINNKELVHQGKFKVEEVFAALNKALQDKNYSRQEKKSEETVTPSGRKLFMELRPYKIVTNYIILIIKIKVYLDDVTEVVEEINGRKEKFDKGNLKIVFDAWSTTDYEDRWGMKPFVYFLKGVINKYIYSFPVEKGAVTTLLGDTAYIYGQLKKLLKSYTGEKAEVVKEEDVMKKVEEEILKNN